MTGPALVPGHRAGVSDQAALAGNRVSEPQQGSLAPAVHRGQVADRGVFRVTVPPQQHQGVTVLPIGTRGDRVPAARAQVRGRHDSEEPLAERDWLPRVAESAAAVPAALAIRLALPCAASHRVLP